MFGTCAQRLASLILHRPPVHFHRLFLVWRRWGKTLLFHCKCVSLSQHKCLVIYRSENCEDNLGLGLPSSSPELEGFCVMSAIFMFRRIPLPYCNIVFNRDVLCWVLARQFRMLPRSLLFWLNTLLGCFLLRRRAQLVILLRYTLVFSNAKALAFVPNGVKINHPHYWT